MAPLTDENKQSRSIKLSSSCDENLPSGEADTNTTHPCRRHTRKFGTMTSCYQTNLIVFQFRGVTRPFLCRGLLCLRARLFRLNASAASFILFASARLSPTSLLLLLITNKLSSKRTFGTGGSGFVFVMFRCYYEFGMLPSVGVQMFVLSCPFLPTIS